MRWFGMYTHIQREVQADNVALRQQLIERDVLRSLFKVLAQPFAVMIDRGHTECVCLLLQIPPDAAHAQNAEDLALRIMSQRRKRLAPPFAFAQRHHARVEVAQGTDDQEHVDVGGCVVDCGWGVGDPNWRRARAAGVHVDLVVSGSWGTKSVACKCRGAF